MSHGFEHSISTLYLLLYYDIIKEIGFRFNYQYSIHELDGKRLSGSNPAVGNRKKETMTENGKNKIGN